MQLQRSRHIPSRGTSRPRCARSARGSTTPTREAPSSTRAAMRARLDRGSSGAAEGEALARTSQAWVTREHVREPGRLFGTVLPGGGEPVHGEAHSRTGGIPIACPRGSNVRRPPHEPRCHALPRRAPVLLVACSSGLRGCEHPLPQSTVAPAASTPLETARLQSAMSIVPSCSSTTRSRGTRVENRRASGSTMLRFNWRSSPGSSGFMSNPSREGRIEGRSLRDRRRDVAGRAAPRAGPHADAPPGSSLAPTGAAGRTARIMSPHRSVRARAPLGARVAPGGPRSCTAGAWSCTRRIMVVPPGAGHAPGGSLTVHRECRACTRGILHLADRRRAPRDGRSRARSTRVKATANRGVREIDLGFRQFRFWPITLDEGRDHAWRAEQHHRR